MYDYSFRLTGEKSVRNQITDESEVAFLVLFTIEASLKIGAYGLVADKGTYLRDGWNVLDICVIFSGWLSQLPGISNMSAIRTVRVLRPLRSVHAVKGMKIIVKSLFRSLPGLINVAAFLMFIFIIFSIVGINTIRGANYQRCRYTKEASGSHWPADMDISHICTLNDFGLYDCPEDRYCGYPSDYDLFDYKFYQETQIPELNWGITNFDNIGTALVTVFQIVTLEGWTPIMYSYYNALNPVFISFYFSCIVMLGSYFLLNLFLAAIWFSFQKVTEEEPKDTKADQDYADQLRATVSFQSRAAIFPIAESEESDSNSQNQLLPDPDSAEGLENISRSPNTSFQQQQPSEESSEPDSGSQVHTETPFALVRQNAIRDHRVLHSLWRWPVRDLVQSKWFTLFITICILVNIGFLASDRYPIDNMSLRAIETANLVFYCIFLVEMALKLIGLGVRGYCMERFNLFDGFIVIISTVEIVLNNTYDNSSESSTSAILAFRAFRLLRLLKLARIWKSLRNILLTIQYTLSDLTYISVLMLLFIMIYALMGMEFFAHRMKFDLKNQVVDDVTEGMSPRINFDDLFHSFEAIFIVLVKYNWFTIFHDAIRTNGYAIPIIYFMTLIVLGQFVLLNLFLAILIGKFQTDIDTIEKLKNKRRGTVIADMNAAMVTGVYGKSLNLFRADNPVRVIAARIINWKHFDNIILVLIIVSSVLLAMDNPLNDPNSKLSQSLAMFNFIVTLLFACEMAMKVIVWGFLFNGRSSYLRDGWNFMDFAIVTFSLISLGISEQNLGKYKAIRAVRVLRPLRLIRRNQSLRVVINSLLRSIPKIGNVLLIAMFFFLLFGIVGVTYFKGTFYHCQFPTSTDDCVLQFRYREVVTVQDCLDFGGIWVNYPSNFDNILYAMLSMMIISTTEGWIMISHYGIDAVGIDQNPIPENNFAWLLFFVIFIIIGSFFIMNLIVGVVIDNFKIEKNIELGDAFLTKA